MCCECHLSCHAWVNQKVFDDLAYLIWPSRRCEPQCDPPRSPGKLNVGCTMQPGCSQYFFFERSFMLAAATAADAIFSWICWAVKDVPVVGSWTGDAVADDDMDPPETSRWVRPPFCGHRVEAEEFTSVKASGAAAVSRRFSAWFLSITSHDASSALHASSGRKHAEPAAARS